MRRQLAVALLFAFMGCQRVQQPQTMTYAATPVTSLRLYVMDCGVTKIAEPSRFRMTREEIANIDLSVPCFLIVHPKGTLLWETGAAPDSAWTPNGRVQAVSVTLTGNQQRTVTMIRTLRSQLAEIGYSPANIDFLALSHLHWDHTANANAFAGSTWLVPQAERDAMFGATPPPLSQPANYAALKNSRTVIVNVPTHDVFGDGTVVLRSAPGHTPGHQILELKLAQTGNVTLSGDLYHHPEARTLQRVPVIEFDTAQSRASRAAIEALLTETGAQLWIQHDIGFNARLRKSPAFYQ